jgi:hypothetical protein
MADQNNQFVDFIDMRLNDPELEAWDGRARRVDPGFYVFEVDEASINQSRAGNPTLALTFRVISEGPMENRTMRRSYAIMPDNDGARSRMKCLIDSLQAPQDEEGRFSASSLVGLQMQGEVVLRTFDTVDSRTGQPVSRETSDIIGEGPVEVQQAAVGQPAVGRPVGQPVGQPVARRTVGGNAQPRR